MLWYLIMVSVKHILHLEDDELLRINAICRTLEVTSRDIERVVRRIKLGEAPADDKTNHRVHAVVEHMQELTGEMAGILHHVEKQEKKRARLAKRDGKTRILEHAPN